MKLLNEKSYATKRAQTGDVILLPDSDHKYVVIDTAFDGGGTGHGPHDIFPNGHHVWAKPLKNDLTYDPQARTIDFYQSGCFNGMIPKVKVIGKMQRVLTFT